MALGGPEQAKESCRDVRGTRWLEDLWHDARYALRTFAKNPGTTAVAVLSLALAIRPNATLFSVVDRLFLKPVTVQGSSQVFFLYARAERQKVPERPSYPDFLDLDRDGRRFRGGRRVRPQDGPAMPGRRDGDVPGHPRYRHGGRRTDPMTVLRSE
jgi:hypothetical protein